MVLGELRLVTGSPEASGLVKDDWSQECELSLLRRLDPRQLGDYQVTFVKQLFGCHTPRDLNLATTERAVCLCRPFFTRAVQPGIGL